MKSLIRIVLLSCGLLLSLGHPAHAAVKLEAKLIGSWEETDPQNNFVSFAKGSNRTLHLQEGEIGEQRSIEGVWMLSGRGELKIMFEGGGQARTMSSRATFVGEELILLGKDGKPVRHRRHKGPLPERFQ